jgi:release factor glutamine methyltransferase
MAFTIRRPAASQSWGYALLFIFLFPYYGSVQGEGHAAGEEMSGRIIDYEVGSAAIRIKVDRKVYMPSAASLCLARNLSVERGSKVLDLGTGSGFLAILASRLGAGEVVATDISTRALQAARINAMLNSVDNVDFRLGPLYEPVRGEAFDLIVSNPPMTPSKNPLPRYTWGGPDGREILDEVIREAPSHLRSGGRLLIPVISLVGIGKTYRLMMDSGFRVRALDYLIHPFGRRLIKLLDYLSSLPDADYVYDSCGRPCWRLLVLEGVKS